MNINRNNYEEYFLLYADNELSKTERKVVEIFVQENTDLKEEFLMIQLTINIPEKEVTLLDKSFLLKKEPPYIGQDNYEEIFVLYYDNELSDEQKKETENFINENSKYKPDFELIGEAQLIPEDSVVYPDRKKLYRKEKSGRVIPLIFWRSLVAAVFVGFGLWVTVYYFNRKQVSAPVATSTNNNPQKPAIKDAKPDVSINSQKRIEKENSIASSDKAPEQLDAKRYKMEMKQPGLKGQKIKRESVAKNEMKTESQPAQQKINVFPPPDVDFQLAISKKPLKELPGAIEKSETSLEDGHAVIEPDKITASIDNMLHAQTVSYVSEPEANNQNYVFYDVSVQEFRKSKVGGFLKKVRRIVERNNPITRIFTGDEEQIAAK